MNTEMTDNNATPAGWVFYDGECALCARGVARFAPVFARRGFVWLPVQSPQAMRALGSHSTSMREEMKLRLANGDIASGLDAWVVLFRSVWWLWPIGALLGLPGFNQTGRCLYFWIARHRHCLSRTCKLEFKRDLHHHRHSAFLEMP